MEIKNPQIERLVHALEKMYDSPGHIAKRGFLLGFVSGIGGIIGAAVAILLLGYLVSKLGWVPYIGDFLQRLNQSVPYR